MCLENLVPDSFRFSVGFRHYILAKKSSLVFGNRAGENYLIPHRPHSQVCIRIYNFNFKKTNKQARKTMLKKEKETKEEKLEGYDS